MLKQLSDADSMVFSPTSPEQNHGQIDAEIVTGENDQPQRKGFHCRLVDSPCKIKVDQADVVAETGQLIAISITNATRFSWDLPYGVGLKPPSRVSVQRKVGISPRWEIFLDDGRPTS